MLIKSDQMQFQISLKIVVLSSPELKHCPLPKPSVQADWPSNCSSPRTRIMTVFLRVYKYSIFNSVVIIIFLKYCVQEMFKAFPYWYIFTSGSCNLHASWKTLRNVSILIPARTMALRRMQSWRLLSLGLPMPEVFSHASWKFDLDLTNLLHVCWIYLTNIPWPFLKNRSRAHHGQFSPFFTRKIQFGRPEGIPNFLLSARHCHHLASTLPTAGINFACLHLLEPFYSCSWHFILIFTIFSGSIYSAPIRFLIEDKFH